MSILQEVYAWKKKKKSVISIPKTKKNKSTNELFLLSDFSPSQSLNFKEFVLEKREKRNVSSVPKTKKKEKNKIK
jgi:hypothetical protein